MKLVLALFMLVTASTAHAAAKLTLRDGVFSNGTCTIEIYKQKSGNYYVEYDSKQSPKTTLRGNHFTVTPAGVILDGPGLCSDQQTFGRDALKKIKTKVTESVAGDVLDVSCGGAREKYQLSLLLTVDRNGDLDGYSEYSRAGMRRQSAECYGLKKVK